MGHLGPLALFITVQQHLALKRKTELFSKLL